MGGSAHSGTERRFMLNPLIEDNRLRQVCFLQLTSSNFYTVVMLLELFLSRIIGFYSSQAARPSTFSWRFSPRFANITSLKSKHQVETKILTDAGVPLERESREYSNQVDKDSDITRGIPGILGHIQHHHYQSTSKQF